MVSAGASPQTISLFACDALNASDPDVVIALRDDAPAMIPRAFFGRRMESPPRSPTMTPERVIQFVRLIAASSDDLAV